MPSHRAERIAVLIQQELAQRLRTEFEHTALEHISLTRVTVTRDLGRATISYMPLGGGEITREMHEMVEAAAKKLRGPVGRALGIRRAPELVFEPDTHTDEAFRINALLDQIGQELREKDREAEE